MTARVAVAVNRYRSRPTIGIGIGHGRRGSDGSIRFAE